MKNGRNRAWKGEQHTSTSNRKLVLCGFFYDAVRISDYMASNDTISDKLQTVLKKIRSLTNRATILAITCRTKNNHKEATSFQAQIRTGHLHNKV